MELQHSCLIVATYETSLTLRGAISGMQNTRKVRHSCLIVVTHETSFALRGATEVTLQRHQILRLPRKMIIMIDPRHINETLFTMRGATGVILQRHQILRLPRKITLMIDPHMKRHLQCAEQQRLPSNITKYCACHQK